MPATNTIEPISISTLKNDAVSYRELIRQLAAQTTTKPYGDIPPMLNNRKKKRQKSPKPKPVRRMSHVEDWIEIDSKETLPDEQELVQSPIRNFLFGDFLTEVLPLHVPPPSLSDNIQQYDDEEDDEEEDMEDSHSHFLHKQLIRRHSISSFQNKSFPTSSTTYNISSSPPHLFNTTNSNVLKATLEKLKQSVITPPVAKTNIKRNNKHTKRLIPMPIPPKRPITSQKRRSEATTQPRFNPDTNTYMRDTRYNPDHLRIISAELNMIRSKKLLSPLKPRGFLPRRKDPFVRGLLRIPSPLTQLE